MSLRKGYRVPSQIVTNDTRDTYPLIDINDSLGGSHIYNIEAEMLAIPVQRRREGMRCYLITPKKYYKLINNPSTPGTTITDWEELAEISVNDKKTFVTNSSLAVTLTSYAKVSDLPNMSLYTTTAVLEANYVKIVDLQRDYLDKNQSDARYLTINDYNTSLPAALAPYAKLTDLPNMNLYYTITAADAKFATKTDLTANYYTSSDVDNKFLTKNDYNTTLATTLLDYAKLTDLPNMNLYYTITAADAKFATKSDLTANYYTSSDVDNKFVTKTDLTANYYTSSDVDSKFVTKTDLTANYYTSSDVDSKFVTKNDLTANYYTSAQCDATFATKKDVSDITDNMKNTIIAITRPGSISVTFGTTAAQVATKLPATIKVTMADGSSSDLPVVWDTSTFNANEEGMQVINGDLTLPAGTINPQVNATMHVKVSEKVYLLDDFVNPMPINIAAPYGAKFEELGLPDKIKVRYVDGTEALVDVEWTNSPKQYDDLELNSQTLNGKLVLPPNVKQSTPEKQPQVVVPARTKPLKVTAFTPFNIKNIDEGTLFHDVVFPANGNVTLEDGSTTTLDIVWEPSGYNSFVAGNQTLFGKFVPKDGVDIPPSLIPTITVNIVRPPNISAIADLDLITVQVGTLIADVPWKSTVDVTLLYDDGSKSVTPYSVSWNKIQDISNPGFYTFEGDIVVPPGSKVKNLLGLKAYQDVQVTSAPVKVISSFDTSQLTPFSVPNGTQPAALSSYLTNPITLNIKDSTGANSTISLRVNWNTSAYNPDVPGTYPITGEFDPADLQANNINNPSNLVPTIMATVSAPAVVKHPSVMSISITPDSITLPVGTPLATIKGSTPNQATVEILEIDGSTTNSPYNINWRYDTYNASKAGIQIIKGDVVLPSGYINPSGLSAEFTVTLEAAPVVGPVSTPEVISVDPIPDIVDKPWGSAIQDLGIPNTVNVTIKKPDGTNTSCLVRVTWNTTNLDTTVPGSYIITGGLNLEDIGSIDGLTIENPRNLEAEIKVTILPKKADPYLTIDTMPAPLTYPFGTPLATVRQDLPTTVDLKVTDSVDSSITSTISVPVTWNDTTYVGNTAGNYTFDGSLTVPSGYDTSQLGSVSIMVTVEPKAADPTTYSINKQFIIPAGSKTWSDPVLNNVSEEDFYGYDPDNDYATRTTEILFVGVQDSQGNMGATLATPVAIPYDGAPDEARTAFRNGFVNNGEYGNQLMLSIPGNGDCLVSFDPDTKQIIFETDCLFNCVYIVRKTGDGTYIK